MKATSLRTFTDRIAETRRLSFADLRRLQRDILPDGPQNRDDVEALLALDLSLERADSGWLECLVNAVTRFVLAASDGVVDADLADWLVPVLTEAQPKTAQAIARAVLAAAEEVDDGLRVFAKAGRKSKVAASSTGLKAHTITGAALPAAALSGALAFQWEGVRFGAPAFTVSAAGDSK